MPERASSIDERAAGPLDTLQQAAFALEAGLDALRQYRRGLSLDPGRLKLVSDRLDLIQRLKSSTVIRWNRCSITPRRRKPV